MFIIILLMVSIIILFVMNYYKYMKYKAKYLDIKKEEINITLINRSSGGIVAPTVYYTKTITIKKNEDYGMIHTIDNKLHTESKIPVSRTKINELLQKINNIWTLPSATSDDDPVYAGFLLKIYIANSRKWQNGKPSGCVHMPPSIVITQEQQQQYDSITKIIYDFA